MSNTRPVSRGVLSAGRIGSLWAALVSPSSAIASGSDREGARLFSALLLMLIAFGWMSGIVQLIFVQGFWPTFVRMAIALLVLSAAYSLSRTRHYRFAVGGASFALIGACTAIPFGNPDDSVWYAFTLMGVGFAAAFLSTARAAGIALVALLATALPFVLIPELQTPARFVPPLMVHAIISPLLLLFSNLRRQADDQREARRLTHERASLQAERLKTLGRLTGGIVHDFNNMVAVVQGNTGLLRAAGGCDEELLSEIQSASVRAQTLTQQLLAFVRTQPRTPQRVNINQMLGELEPILRRIAGPRVKLELCVDNDVPALMLAPVELEQIIVNLITNARDATQDDGEITIQTRRLDSPRRAQSAVGSRLLLRISDSGVGMDSETIKHIFEPFFTTKAAQGGTGLGLATVHELVHKNGGSITVESVLGRGTTFSITLPAVDLGDHDSQREREGTDDASMAL